MSGMKIPYADFHGMHDPIRAALSRRVEDVIDRNCFIYGDSCKAFEKHFAAYCRTAYCVGCGNGLDALQLILRAQGIGDGDEVIVPAHTYIATALAVSYVGAKPVFVDVEDKYYCLDPEKLELAITPHTKAIIMVHIYGQVGRFAEVAAIANRHGLLIIEDAAQSHGAEYRGIRTGHLGDAAGFSFYPGKNLGAFGDAGAVVTDRKDIADAVRMMSNYGSTVKYHHEVKGVNSRMDELQAAILDEKLPHLDMWNAERQHLAMELLAGIHNDKLMRPEQNPDGKHVWHIFPVMVAQRDEFVKYLHNHGIMAQIHYPYPMHLHGAYRELGYSTGNFPVAEAVAEHEVSLPLYYGMQDEQIHYMIDVINQY